MSPIQIRKDLVDYFHSNFSDAPVVYDNSQLPASLRDQPHVAFSVKFTTSRTIIRGSGTETRYHGYIEAYCKTKALTGSNRAFEMASNVASLMERKRIGSITTRQSEIDVVRNNREYYIVAAIIPFVTSI